MFYEANLFISHIYNKTIKLIVQVNTYILSDVLLRSITEYFMSCAVF